MIVFSEPQQLLKRIETQEWSTIDCLLSADELNTLASIPSKVLQFQRISSETVRIKTNSIVGRFRTNAIDFIIHPKLSIDSLLYMLGAVYGIEKLHKETAGFKSKVEVDDLLVRVFINYATKILRQGIRKRYIAHTEQLSSVRGRINVRRTTALYYRGNPSVECEFDEHTSDCIENQILKTTLELVLDRSAESVQQRQAVRSLLRQLLEVKSIPPSLALRSEVQSNRLNQHYFPAIPLARIILSSMGVAHDFGSIEMNGFHVDMNLLFERYIERRLRKELSSHSISVDAQNSSPFDFDRQATIRPDLILQSKLGKRFVADTKYKVTNKPDRNDLYQLLTYCQVLGIEQGALITVGDFSDRHYSVANQKTSINVFPVCTQGNPEALELETRKLAKKLRSLVEN